MSTKRTLPVITTSTIHVDLDGKVGIQHRDTPVDASGRKLHSRADTRYEVLGLLDAEALVDLLNMTARSLAHLATKG